MAENGMKNGEFEHKPLQAGQLVVHTLRRALASVVTSVGADASQPQEISRRFGVDKTLAWRISRAIREEDAWQALEHLPSRSGISIFAQALSKGGAAADRVEHLNSAMDDFDRFVEEHAGDRDTFEMMVSTPDSRAARKKLESVRKNGFQCNSMLLGVRATTHFAAHFVQPSAQEGMVDMAIASGLVELVRLRPSLPWPVATIRNWSGAFGKTEDKREALHSIDDMPTGVNSPVIRDFCTPPNVNVYELENPPGTFRFMLDGGDVGYRGASNVVSGWITRSTAPMRETVPGEQGEHGVTLTTPAEELVFDVLVHESLTFAMNISARVYGQFPGSPHYPAAGSEHTLLPMPTDVLDLGYSVPDAPHAALARYGELLDRVAKRLGRPLEQFRTFRYRLKYPPVPAMVLLTHPLLPVRG